MSALHVRYGAAQVLPLDLLLSTLPSLPRAALNRLVERAIDRMDELDGDTDIEANGDELDGQDTEDEFLDRGGWSPGCPIADPDMGVDDEGEDDRNSDV